MKNIDSEDISIVVQGPVIGKESDPPSFQLTKICVESLRQLFPKSEIILSTWSEISQHWIKYDKLIINEEPPEIERITTTRKDVNYNGNRLICTTANGIRASTRDYVLKVRSDIMFTSSVFLESFTSYIARDSSFQVSEHRIIIPELLTSVNLFSINDWVSFGTRHDMLKLWDIPFMQKLLPISNDLFMNNEQYICYNFLKTHPLFSIDDQEVLERLFANNFVILNANSFSFQRLKPFHFSITTYYGWTTHYDWKCLYKAHSLHCRTINYRNFIRPAIMLMGKTKSILRNAFKLNRNEIA